MREPSHLIDMLLKNEVGTNGWRSSRNAGALRFNFTYSQGRDHYDFHAIELWPRASASESTNAIVASRQ